MISSKAIILVLPHIDGNRTSIERFKSFMFALKQNYVHVKIVYIKFPKSGDEFLGVTENKLDTQSIATIYHNDLISIKPSLNIIQSLFFNIANADNRKMVKPLIWLHQLVFGEDIFTPTHKIDSSSLIIPKVNNGFIIAFGGPFGVFSVANSLSEHLGYKLVLDYRDPWTYGFAPIDGYNWIHKIKKIFKNKYEYQLLEKSVLITTVSNSLKAYFPTEIQKKICVIPNGSNTSNLTPNINPHPDFFTIVYAGTMYDMQLNDNTFFEALEIFISEKDITKIKLFFLGSVGNKLLPIKLKKYGLLPISTITKRLDKEKLVIYMSNASCFLQLRYGNNNGIITSKQAEYLAYRKAILLPQSDSGDIAESIIQNNAGTVCYTVENNVLFLNKLWDKFLNQQSLTLNTITEAKDNRENIAKNFVKLIMGL